MRNNSNLTIVAPHCWSYFFHQHYGRKYNTPFVDILISPDQYLNIISNFFKIDFDNISRIDSKIMYNENKYVDRYENYPRVILDNLALMHPIHCRSYYEFKTKWLNRAKRINFHKLLFIYSDYYNNTKQMWDFLEFTKNDFRIIFTLNESIESNEKTLVFHDLNKFYPEIDDSFKPSPELEEFIKFVEDYEAI